MLIRLGKTTKIALGWALSAVTACSHEPAAIDAMGGQAGSIRSGTNGGAGSTEEPTTGGAPSGAGNGGKGGAAAGGLGGAATGGLGGATGGTASAAAGRAGSAAASAGSADASACAGHDWLLCEDFEDTEPGGVPSGWTRHGELAAVDDTDAHSGTRALRLGPTANAERRIYHDAKLLGSAHWGRIYFKVQTPVPDGFVHSTLVSLIGNGPKNGRSDYRPIDTVKQAKDTRDVGGRHNYLYNVQIIGKSEFGSETSYDYAFDAKWHCAEYHIDASDQSYTLYLEGKDVLHFTRGAGNYDGADIPSQFDELRVGWVNYQSAAPGFTAFIDDIAFDDARIGCD